MLGILNMLNDGVGMDASRKRFFGLTAELEGVVLTGQEAFRCERAIDVAAQLRNMLRAKDLGLTRKEKVRVLKTITRAKVKAFMGGTPGCFDGFRTLDTISSDVVQLL